MSEVSHEKICYPLSGIPLSRDACAYKKNQSIKISHKIRTHEIFKLAQNIHISFCQIL